VRRFIGAALVLLLTLPAVGAAQDAPAWLDQLARSSASRDLETNVDAVVLLDDLSVTVGENGRIVMRRQYAVKVLTRAGAAAAVAREIYTTDAGEVRSIRGWVVGGGTATRLGNADVADLALVNDDVYNQARMRLISGSSRIEPGMVFGAETEVAERTLFTQFDWLMQERWPVRSVRRMLTLPVGWDARSVTFNAAAIEPQRNGSSLLWSASDLAAPPEEPAGPAWTALVPRVAVTYFARGRENGFDDWPSVSRWLAMLAEPSGAATPTLTTKARELTTGATDDLDRVRRIGAYVQKVQYISIQLGTGRGGGYTPHPAADVLTKNYGDCKDKANLMRTMLASVGVRSYLVAVYSGDPEYVRSEWPSPQQFNHMILAIAIDAPTRATLRHDRLGTLLIFDPTDEHTPVGELASADEGSLALVVATEGGPLVRVPADAPEASPRVRRVNASIDANGTLTASVVHTTHGTAAALERGIYQSLSREEYVRMLEAAARRQVSGASLMVGDVADDRAGNRFELSVKLQAPGYAQVVQNRLLLVRPPRTLRSELPSLASATRRTPIVLDAREEQDTFTLELPAGVVVDEMPEPRKLDTTFGQFAVAWQAQDGHVTRTLSLRMPRAVLPPSSYPEVRAFLDAFREAETLPVVLVRR